MLKKNSLKRVVMLLTLVAAGCRTPPASAPEARRPPVGIIRSVNLPERYVVFEAEFTFPPGSKLRLLRQRRVIGRLEAQNVQRRKFQAADILEGRPQPGDLVEPVLTVQPQPAQQTEGGRLSP